MRNYKVSSQRYGYGRYPRKVAFSTAQRMSEKGHSGSGLEFMWGFVGWIGLAIFFAIANAH